MMVTVVAESPDEEFVLPEHPEGGEWLHVLMHSGNQISCADNATELVGVIIDGYAELDPSANEEADAMRGYHASVVAANAQYGLAQAGVAQGDLLVGGGEDNDVLWTTLLSGKDRPLPVNLPVMTGQEWTHPVPLVLVDIFYYPYSTLKPPTGNVTWVRSVTEVEYLEALSEMNLVNYFKAGRDGFTDVTG